MGIPTYFLLSGFFWLQPILMYNSLSIYANSSALASYYTILTLTIVAWVIEIISIRYMLPNIMAICRFCNNNIGSWWLVNFAITLCIGWKYIPLSVIFIVFPGILTPAIIWHITGDIIQTYTAKLISEIAEMNSKQSLASTTMVSWVV